MAWRGTRTRRMNVTVLWPTVLGLPGERVVAVVRRRERPEIAFGDRRQTEQTAELGELHSSVLSDSDSSVLAGSAAVRINPRNAFGAVLLHGGGEPPRLWDSGRGR